MKPISIKKPTLWFKRNPKVKPARIHHVLTEITRDEGKELRERIRELELLREGEIGRMEEAINNYLRKLEEVHQVVLLDIKTDKQLVANVTDEHISPFMENVMFVKRVVVPAHEFIYCVYEPVKKEK